MIVTKLVRYIEVVVTVGMRTVKMATATLFHRHNHHHTHKHDSYFTSKQYHHSITITLFLCRRP